VASPPLADSRAPTERGRQNNRDGARLRVALLTGIFPPDTGGPATHSADLAAALRHEGHAVTVVTLVDAPTPQVAPGLVRFPRAWPWPRRMAVASWWLRTHREHFDVIYATGLHEVGALGGWLAGLPVVAKVVGDHVWERARRGGLTTAAFDDFQRQPAKGARIRAMAALRNASLRAADRVLAPSRQLALLVQKWIGAPDIRVVRNGVRLDGMPGREEPPAAPPLRLIAACRLVAHKRLDVVLDALAQVPDVTLDIVGEGPEAPGLAHRVRALGLEDRVAFSGTLCHEDVLRHLTAAHALVVASDYEGLPHTAIEALCCGTPVVTVPVGGMLDVVEDGVNGLVVRGDPNALASAFVRLRDDEALRRVLTRGAVAGGPTWSFDSCRLEIESILREVARSKPRAVFVGKSALSQTELGEKLHVLGRHLDVRMVTLANCQRWGRLGHRVLALPRSGPAPVRSTLFYTVGPALGVALAIGRRPGGVVCQSPFEGVVAVVSARIVPRARRPPVIVEVHGDWRTAARLYGGGARRPLGPLADRVAVWALRRADLVRTVGEFTDALVADAGYRGTSDRYIAYSSYAALLATGPSPLPTEPRAVFVGAMEPYKGVDVLIEAWHSVQVRMPQARLTLVGTGSQLPAFRARADHLGLSATVTFAGSLPQTALAGVLDESSVLVLPSRSEGLGRVILEAHSRGRPVVASAVGGIPELVQEGHTGLLVPSEHPDALAEALLSLLPDRTRQAAMGAAGRAGVEARDPQAEFEAGVARLAAYLRDRCVP
jgi:glycosyltransferase involved in cell wall biosynthesis